MSNDKRSTESLTDLWQTIYDAAANKGSVLHDDTVWAIEKAVRAALRDIQREMQKIVEAVDGGCYYREVEPSFADVKRWARLLGEPGGGK